MKKRIYQAVTLMLVLFFAAGGAGSAFAAAAADSRRDKREPVRVAMLQYPNFIDYDEDGRPSGFSCDYLDEIAKYTGWTYEYVPASFTEAQDMLERGEIDIVAGTQYTEARAARYDYSAVSMAVDSNVLCVPAGNTEYYYNNFAALEGKTIGVMTGSIRKAQFEEVLEAAGVSVVFQEFDTDAAEKEALREGTVTAILMTALRCTSDYRIIASTNPTNVYFTCNPHDPSIKAGIDEAQQEILAANPYFSLALSEKHYGNVPRAYAFTDEERTYLDSAPTITVAVSPDQKPTEYYDEAAGAFHGLVIDYLEKISEITGLRFQYVTRGDKASTVQALQSGDLQLIASVAERANIENAYPVTLTSSYYQNSVVIAYNSSVRNPLSSDCRIALKSGFVYYQGLAETQGYTDIQYYDTLMQCVEAVNRGDADLTYMPGYSASRVTSHAYFKSIKTLASPISEYACSIGVSDQCNPLLVSILDKSLAAIPAAEKEALLLNAVSNNSDAKTFRDVFYENLTTILGVGILLCAVIGFVGFSSALRRKRANLQLAAAMDSAQRANAAKSDFLSRMSHDMRTPMNGIIGLTALTADLPELPEEARENLAAIEDSSRYLMNLINDVLDMNKIESAKLTLNEETIPSESFIKNVIASVEPVARQKGICLNYVPENLQGGYVRGDRVRLQQIFVNILSNAIKFTPEGGNIRIEVARLNQDADRADVRIRIADSGVGMSEAYLPHLFEPFSQEGRTAELNFAGTGLGMSIVKNLVELMGGRIEAESKLNQGTTITVYLTLRCVEGGAPAAAQEGRTADVCLCGKRALLVEDHPLNTKIAVKMLEKKDMTVECAENGQAGVAMFTQSQPGYYDVILMDIRMPVMNGIEAAKAIRALPRPDAAAVPILAMTANAFDEDVKASLRAGMNAHLTKPIDPSALYEMLSAYLRKK